MVDPISMMDYLFKAARAHEAKNREREENRAIDVVAAIPKKNKKRKRDRTQRQPAYVEELKHINIERPLRYES